MDRFTSDLQSFKQSFSFLDIDDPIPTTMESPDQFTHLNHNHQSVIENTALNYQSFLPFSSDNLLSNPAIEIPSNWSDNLPAFIHHSTHSSVSAAQPINITAKTEFQESKKRKSLDLSETSSRNSSSPQVPQTGIKRRNNSGRGKRAKSNEEEEKPKEVVHVRARRGQATDSHSLAERVRRGKINERLRCLQDIVPGCYKTMGMAVMLDEIINYVQSLQNQVEVSTFFNQ
ncbi:hypothetical protein PTKIN_Ptkin04bG0111700 [Pterospermum kingtungense]